MRKFPSTQHLRASISMVWVGIAIAILVALVGAAATSRMASANDYGRADLEIVLCVSEGIELTWRTENEGRAAAPDGWKVERSHLDSQGTPVLQTFTFIGDDADALLKSGGENWEWVDSAAAQNVLYTYRVRAINADGSDMAGRAWSRNALAECFADTIEPPGISVPYCQDSGVSMFWHAANGGSADKPDGWKVERSNQDPQGNWIVQTFTFIGADADALQTVRDDFWDWVDTTADRYVDYSYRVRAINSDGSDMAGRIWSRHAAAICTGGILDQPGMSVPRCQDNGVSMFWHTRNRGRAEAPEGWKIERRHWDSENWVVQTFTFIGAEAAALQTHSEEYWDWVDTSAGENVDYTYRVRAINADGSDKDGRIWSQRAPVQC